MFDLVTAEWMVQRFGGDLGLAWEECMRAQKRWRVGGASFKNFWVIYYRNRLRQCKEPTYLPLHESLPAPEPQEYWEAEGPYADYYHWKIAGWSDTKIRNTLKLSRAKYENYKRAAADYCVATCAREV